MKKFLLILAAGILLFAGCPNNSTPMVGNTWTAESHTAEGVSFNMHYVPSGGPFTMGEDVVSPTQEVTLTKNFWMGETEVFGKLCGEQIGLVKMNILSATPAQKRFLSQTMGLEQIILPTL